MAGADASVEQLTAAIGYLRIAVGGDRGPEWLSCADLVADPAALRAVVASTAPALGTERDDIAMSLFVQGYAFRVAAVTLGTWLVTGTPVAVDPARSAIAIGRGRPNAVRLDEARVLVGASDEHVHEHLIEQHLAPLVDTARNACRIGGPLLWGNVASSCVRCFAAVAGVQPSRRAEIRERVTAFVAAGRPELRDAGVIVPVGDHVAWERRSCCLWYQAPSATGMCDDCSLRTDAERRDRHTAMLADQEQHSTHARDQDQDHDKDQRSHDART